MVTTSIADNCFPYLLLNYLIASSAKCSTNSFIGYNPLQKMSSLMTNLYHNRVQPFRNIRFRYNLKHFDLNNLTVYDSLSARIKGKI